MKSTDAARLDRELQQPIRDLYEITASVFRRFPACSAWPCRGTDTGLKFQIDRLSEVILLSRKCRWNSTGPQGRTRLRSG